MLETEKTGGGRTAPPPCPAAATPLPVTPLTSGRRKRCPFPLFQQSPAGKVRGRGCFAGVTPTDGVVHRGWTVLRRKRPPPRRAGPGTAGVSRSGLRRAL